MTQWQETALPVAPSRPGAVASAAAWSARQLRSERECWILWLPVAFGTGIAVYFSLATEPPRWSGPLALAAAFVLALLSRQRGAQAVLAIGLAVVSAGFTMAQTRVLLVAAPVLERRVGPSAVTGRIVQVEVREPGNRLTLEHARIAGLAPGQTPAVIRISVAAGTGDLAPGDWVRLRAVLRPPPEPAAPGAFDFARRAYFDRLGAVGFAYGGARRVDPPPGAQPAGILSRAARAWHDWWAARRLTVTRRVLATLPGQRGAVAAALMTGERGAISAEVKQAMRDSGLAHLLAISGLHLGLVTGLLFVGLRSGAALVPVLALRFSTKKSAAAVAAAGAFAYLMVSGATVPTQRAFLMVLVVLLAVVLDRRAISTRSVAFAALAVLIIAPETLLSASFQLSFAAVTALIAAYEALQRRGVPFLADKGGIAHVGLYVGGAAFSSLIAGFATAPFAVYHFGRIAWYGLAANVIAVPLAALWIMPWAVIAYGLMPLGLERWALVPMGWGIGLLLAVANWIASWPGAASAVPAMPTVGLVLATLGGLWLCLWRRRWRLAGLPLIAGGFATILFQTPPDILASGDGRLFAVRPPDGPLLLSTRVARRFDAEIWRRRVGDEETAAWETAASAGGLSLRCDALGCIYRVAGHIAALVQDQRALPDDCVVATVVVSREPVRGQMCRDVGRVIDRFDLWRYGAHAVWLTPERVTVETVASRRGVRPWVRERRSRRTQRPSAD